MKNIKHYIKMNFKRSFCIFLILLLLAGCSAPVRVEETPAPIALPTPTPAVQPAPGGELVMPIPRNPFRMEDGTALTPLTVNTEEMRNFYSIVYDQLFRCDVNNRLIPGLAEKWSADDTGKVWTLQLRENVMWHDGEHVLSADDVVHTINTILALEESSYYYPLLSESLDSMERVDSRTLIVTMKRPGTSSLYALLFPVLLNGETGAPLNGTGPYKLVTGTDTYVELTANAQWWRQTPYIEKMRFLPRDNNDVALDSYDAGQLNVVPTANVSAGKHREEGVTNVQDVYTQDCEVLLINHTRAPLNDLNVRKAIAHAIDRSAIIANVYMNRAAISDVPVPPDSFLYDPATKIYDYDRPQAEGLLHEAGWIEKNEEGIYVKDGRELRFRLLVNDNTESAYRRNAANILQTQLAEVGIALDIEEARLSVGEQSGEYEQKLMEGDFHLAMAGFYLARNGDVTPYVSRNGDRNYGKYSGETLEALSAAANTAVEEKDMREAHAIFQQAFVQELPFITLYFRLSSLVYAADIKGVEGVRGSDILRTAYRWYIEVQEG